MNDPLPVVAVVSTHFHEPPFCFWITTGTKESHAANPSATLTLPVTRLLLPKLKVTVRACSPPPVTVKVATLFPVTPPAVTPMVPVVALAGTVVVIWVPVEFTVKLVVVPLPNRTEVAPAKFVPVMTTLVPTAPLVGVNDVTVGPAAVTVNVAKAGPPDEFVTEIVPAPIVVLGTTTVMLVLLRTLRVAESPLIVTAVVPQKLVPVTVTVAPIAPLPATTVGIPWEVTVNEGPAADPPVVDTVTGPVIAPHGTVVTGMAPSVSPLWVATAPPPKVTAVTADESPPLKKPLPLIVTGVIPAIPVPGV